MRASELGERIRSSPRVLLAVVFCVYGALYARTATYSFVWDDIPAVIQNPLYEGSWSAGLAATQHDHLDLALRRMGEARPAHDSYRPALYLSHRIERALYGRSPVGHHIHNVTLGALAIALVWALGRRWLGSDAKAVAVAAIFALHPLQVEPIAYVSGRGDELSAVFALLSLLCAMRGADVARRRAAWRTASALAYVLALLSKEAYVGLPAALLVIAWARGRLRTHVLDAGALVIALALYLGLRLSMARVAGGGSGLEGALLLPGLWLQYLRVWLAPVDLSIARPLDPALRIPGWFALISVAAAFIVASCKPLAGAWVGIRHLTSGLLFALVLIGPSAIVVQIMGVVADRYVYLPLVGFAVALVAAGELITARLPVMQRPLRVLAAAGALFWLGLTTLQISVWRDVRSLYTRAVVVEPESSTAVYGLGLVHAEAGEWHLAEPLFARAAELDPKNGRAWNNLAVCALRRGDYSRAIEMSERALAVSPVPFRALYNLATAHLQLGHRDQGCEALHRSLANNPSYRQARELMKQACSPKP